MMVDDRQASCTDRIAGHLASRAEDVRKMLLVSGDEDAKVCQHCGQAIEQDDTTWRHVDTGECRCDGADDEPGIAWGDLIRQAEPDEDYNEDSLYAFGLGVSRKVVIRFDMSTGGPADWLEILCDEEREERQGGTTWEVLRFDVERVTYHFSDWFDHAEENVPEGSPLYELAEWIAETQAGN